MILAILFIAFALLHYNDPDPFIWMFVYGVTGLLCVYTALGKSFRLGNITVIVFSIVWMVLLIPQFVEWIVGGTPISNGKKHNSVKIEFAREFFGLFLAILTMLFHLYSSKKSNQLI